MKTIYADNFSYAKKSLTRTLLSFWEKRFLSFTLIRKITKIVFFTDIHFARFVQSVLTSKAYKCDGFKIQTVWDSIRNVRRNRFQRALFKKRILILMSKLIYEITSKQCICRQFNFLWNRNKNHKPKLILLDVYVQNNTTPHFRVYIWPRQSV